MNNYKRRHEMLGYLFDFYKQKYDSTTSREFPSEDYRIPIATFNNKMGIVDYRDEAVLDPLLGMGKLLLLMTAIRLFIIFQKPDA